MQYIPSFTRKPENRGATQQFRRGQDRLVLAAVTSRGMRSPPPLGGARFLRGGRGKGLITLNLRKLMREEEQHRTEPCNLEYNARRMAHTNGRPVVLAPVDSSRQVQMRSRFQGERYLAGHKKLGVEFWHGLNRSS